ALLLFGLAMIIAGLAFKASAAPFHMWTPDVYEGAPTPLTAFMAAATKTVALVVTLRILVTAFPGDAYVWTRALAVIAVCSLVIGNLAALVQKGVKRMLAYSSISHAGFMLIAVASGSSLGARALLYYLVPYAAMSIGSFAVVAARAEPARPLGGATSGAIGGGSPPRDALLQTAVLACLVVTVGSFFAVQPLIDVAKHAASSLPF